MNERINIKRLVFVIEVVFDVAENMGIRVVEEALDKLQEEGEARIVAIQAEPAPKAKP